MTSAMRVSGLQMRATSGRYSSVQGINRHKRGVLEGPRELGHSIVQTFIGKVVSTACQRTCNVEVAHYYMHPRLRRYIKRTSRLMTHDALEETNYGDVVEIRTCRPISKMKHHVLHRIVKPRHALGLDRPDHVPQPTTYRSILKLQQDRERQEAHAAAGGPGEVELLEMHQVDTDAPLPQQVSYDMIETPLPLVRRRGAQADAEAIRQMQSEAEKAKQKVEKRYQDQEQHRYNRHQFNKAAQARKAY